MEISAYNCPNCKRSFSPISDYNVFSKQVVLDVEKKYQYINVFCDKCLTQINGLILDQAIFWNAKYQYYYDKYVKNLSSKTNNKKYLYAYFPYCEQGVVKSLFSFIKTEQFDVLVIPQYLAKFIQWDKQICLLPSNMFAGMFNTIYPNYLAQMILLKQAQKYDGSLLYSLYYTFCEKFNILYNIKKWQKFKILLN